MFSSRCFTGMPYLTAVVSSVAYCPNPPSPVTATIGRSAAAAHEWLLNDAPTAISRSASFISQPATGVPLRPSTPAPSGWVSGTRPLALNVVRTGAPRRSASAVTSATASRAPWPTTNTGRRASRTSAAAAVTAAAAGGPDRPDRRPSGVTASAAGSAWSLPLWTVVVDTATSRKTAERSTSWNAPRPRTFDGTWPEIASTGAPSSLAS